jgi:8-oxo-dGTP diphosphatase
MADMLERDESAPRVVVAAVIERDGLILAARRVGPPALAGRWEFPGGKVEPGESDVEALVRECREELGVNIAVGERIGPEYPTPGGKMTVRTYRAVIDGGEDGDGDGGGGGGGDGAGNGNGGGGVGGEPEPLDGHDALTWVRPGSPEARALPWLEGDLLILDALDTTDAADVSGSVHRVA